MYIGGTLEAPMGPWLHVVGIVTRIRNVNTGYVALYCDGDGTVWLEAERSAQLSTVFLFDSVAIQHLFHPVFSS